jgi:hypothetical protein
MKQLFFTLLFLSNIASAFTFDVWESKISLDEAIQIAKTNNLPLCKDGAINAGKEFKESCLYLEKYPNNRVFRYTTTLLNQKAIVDLYFTKNSKKLYNLKVRWMKRNKEFVDTVYTLLDKKYGKRETVISSNIGDFILSKIRQWKPNDETIIQTKTSMAGTELNYYDVEESHKEDEERKKIKIEKKEKALIKDANKF